MPHIHSIEIVLAETMDFDFREGDRPREVEPLRERGNPNGIVADVAVAMILMAVPPARESVGATRYVPISVTFGM